MALAFQSSNIQINSTVGAACTVVAPSPIEDNDTLLFILDRAAVSGTIIWPGFEEIDDVGYSGGSFAWAWKRAASESGNYEATWTGNSRNVGIIYVIHGGVTSERPFGSPTAATGNSTTPDPPLMEPGNSEDRFAIALCGQENKDGSFTAPSGYTNLLEGSTAGAGGPASHSGLAVASRSYVGEPENPGPFTSTVDAPWVAQTIVFNQGPEDVTFSLVPRSDRRARFGAHTRQ